MKNDTQTHAANPADNATAQHTLEWHVELDAETDAPKSWPQGRAVCEGNKLTNMKTTLRIICSPLPPRINTVLVLALLCCIAGMTLIAQQAPQPKAPIEPIVRFTGTGSWASPTVHAVKVGDWFVLHLGAPRKSTDVDAALSSLDFTPAGSVLIVKNEPVVAKQADGTWKITFNPNEPKP